MLRVIAETDRPVGIKPSGGIRTIADAGLYLALADDIMGPDWVSPATFRFGASGVLDALVAALDGTRARAGRFLELLTPGCVAAGGHPDQARRRRTAGRGDRAVRRRSRDRRRVRRASGGIGDGDLLQRDDARRAGRAHAGDDPQRCRAGVGRPRRTGGRQALDGRRGRHGEPDAGACRRRVRRVRADDLRPRDWVTPAGRSTRCSRSRGTTRCRIARRSAASCATSAARSSARPTIWRPPTSGSTRSATSPPPSSRCR